MTDPYASEDFWAVLNQHDREEPDTALDARTDRARELSDDPVLAWPQETT